MGIVMSSATFKRHTQGPCDSDCPLRYLPIARGIFLDHRLADCDFNSGGDRQRRPAELRWPLCRGRKLARRKCLKGRDKEARQCNNCRGPQSPLEHFAPAGGKYGGHENRD